MVRVSILALALPLLVVPAARAEIFLQLVGATQGPIGGESTFPGEEGMIEIFSLNYGSSSDGGFPPRLNASSVSLTKLWDSASINLAAALGTREVFSTCILRVYGPGAGPAPGGLDGLERRIQMGYELQIQLIGARLDSHSVGSSGDQPSEFLSLVFEEIRIEHAPSQDTFIWSHAVVPRLASAGLSGEGITARASGNPLEFALPSTGDVTIEVTDPDGRVVRSLVYGDVSGYEGRVVWDATDDAGPFRFWTDDPRRG